MVELAISIRVPSMPSKQLSPPPEEFQLKSAEVTAQFDGAFIVKLIVDTLTNVDPTKVAEEILVNVASRAATSLASWLWKTYFSRDDKTSTAPTSITVNRNEYTVSNEDDLKRIINDAIKDDLNGKANGTRPEK